jgi:hypothetical protein
MPPLPVRYTLHMYGVSHREGRAFTTTTSCQETTVHIRRIYNNATPPCKVHTAHIRRISQGGARAMVQPASTAGAADGLWFDSTPEEGARPAAAPWTPHTHMQGRPGTLCIPHISAIHRRHCSHTPIEHKKYRTDKNTQGTSFIPGCILEPDESDLCACGHVYEDVG